MGAYPPPRREPGGVRQARRESVLSARREASDRLVRDQLDQQQLARAEQLSVWSAEEELAAEKRMQRDMRCAGPFKPSVSARSPQAWPRPRDRTDGLWPLGCGPTCR